MTCQKLSVLGLYRLRKGKLARAQMFYIDSGVVVAFLSKAKAQTAFASWQTRAE